MEGDTPGQPRHKTRSRRCLSRGGHTLGRNCTICCASRSTLFPAASAVTSYRSGRSAQMSSVCVPMEPVDPSSEILRWKCMCVCVRAWCCVIRAANGSGVFPCMGSSASRRMDQQPRSISQSIDRPHDGHDRPDAARTERPRRPTFLSWASARSTVCLKDSAVLTAPGNENDGGGSGAVSHVGCGSVGVVGQAPSP